MREVHALWVWVCINNRSRLRIKTTKERVGNRKEKTTPLLNSGKGAVSKPCNNLQRINRLTKSPLWDHAWLIILTENCWFQFEANFTTENKNHKKLRVAAATGNLLQRVYAEYHTRGLYKLTSFLWCHVCVCNPSEYPWPRLPWPLIVSIQYEESYSKLRSPPVQEFSCPPHMLHIKYGAWGVEACVLYRSAKGSGGHLYSKRRSFKSSKFQLLKPL